MTQELMEGYQRVADIYGLTVYVYASDAHKSGYASHTNRSQVIGPVLYTVEPVSRPTAAPEGAHGLGNAEPANYGAAPVGS